MGPMAGSHLFVVHVGPVQEFIASARRTRDLWFGSWLLSELAKAAALEIVAQNEGDVSCLIFPAPEDQDELRKPDFSAPNKVVARVRQDPAVLGAAVREAVLRRLRGMWAATFGSDGQRSVSGDFDSSSAERQLEDFPEVYWVSWPLEAGDDGYKAARDAAEALLHARKETRDFRPVTWGSDRPKCSLDGSRESVIRDDAVRGLSERDLRKRYGVRRGEHLCGVCLLKRHGARGEQTHFPSTSHVAALPLLQRLEDRHRDMVQQYANTLRLLGVPDQDLGTASQRNRIFGRMDGELLFEERLRELIDDKAQLKKAREALRKLIEEAFGGEEPLPYYALLSADGDHMGEVIDAQEHPDKHRRLSRRQSEFAQEARGIVERHQGSLVYSGGDDVLAFVPLHTVLACARELADTFRNLLCEFTVTGDHDSPISPTLSVGIAIAHHLLPLSDSLELARSAVQTAKSPGGRNALAVTLSKRSGVDRTVWGHWDELDKRLEGFARLHMEDAIPDGAAYELHDLALQLKGTQDHADSDTLDTLRRILSAEVKRILSRKRARGGTEPIAPQTLEELLGYIDEQITQAVRPCDGVIRVADEIVVARVLASAMKLATVPPQS